jgi:DNA-binding transcriptional regulator YhcF (GntR family)
MSIEPPYLRIAAVLRRRIRSGELGPGAKVPSTRELAREWNVALATAAHALKALADEGLVRGVPRSGTVVAGTGSSPKRAVARDRDSDLSRERIVDIAIALADAEGLNALSLRGVAAKLRAPVMSLYRHVANKDELLDLMADNVLGEERLPSARPRGWRAQLEIAAHKQWRVLRRHPWLARLMSITRPKPLPNALYHADWILGALDHHGLDASTRMELHILLHAYIQGLAVNLEVEAEAAGETGLSDDDWMQTQVGAFHALAASGRYPAFASTLKELDADFDLRFEALFERGLKALLDGFERIIERR